jgi:PAS domain S-box-containing protein
MIYLDLITNLALLVALSVVSGFFDKRFPRNTWQGFVLQGVLFGTVAVIGMLRPLVMGPGLIFDGRTVMLSLCALFFGPRSTLIACGIAIICRVSMGGAGVIMGLATIVSSSLIGLWAHYRFKPSVQPPSILMLYGMGLAVHLAMVALMFTLPGELALSTFKRLGWPVVLLYPLATILAGKVLADHLSTLHAHEALRESEARYSLLFDASLDAVLLMSPDGCILDANPAACRLFGRTKEELILLGRSAIVDTEDARLIPALAERARTGKFAGELTFLRKDGFKFEGEISSSVFHTREGQARTGIIIRDISERKVIEERVQKIQNMLNETQRISQVGGWEFDPVSKRMTWTDEVYRIHGVDKDFDPSVPEQDMMLLYVPEDRIAIAEAFRGAVEQGRPYDLELQVVTPHGERKWVRTIGEVEQKNGRVVRVFGNIIDITKGKASEETARQSQQRLRRFYESGLMGVIYWNADGTITDANDKFLEMTGYNRDDLAAEKINGYAMTPPEYRDVDERSVFELTATGINKAPFEKEYIRKDGSRIPILLAGALLDEKKFCGMAFVLDITERKQAEDELREKEVQYRNLADSGLALIWRAGTDKLCTYFNEPWLKFTGRTLAQEWGNGWTEGVHPEDLDRCVGIFVTAFDKRETFDMEYRLKHASGEYRWIRDLGTPNFSSSGEFVGYIGHCFDITVQKQAEEKIRKFNEDLEQKVEERTARLQESIVQLEELNRVFVGRELKMAELKARISQLEGKT